MDGEISDARKLGWDAFHLGLPKNPFNFRAEPEDWFQWWSGYEDAKEAAQKKYGVKT